MYPGRAQLDDLYTKLTKNCPGTTRKERHYFDGKATLERTIDGLRLDSETCTIDVRANNDIPSLCDITYTITSDCLLTEFNDADLADIAAGRNKNALDRLLPQSPLKRAIIRKGFTRTQDTTAAVRIGGDGKVTRRCYDQYVCTLTAQKPNSTYSLLKAHALQTDPKKEERIKKGKATGGKREKRTNNGNTPYCSDRSTTVNSAGAEPAAALLPTD